MMLGFKNSPVIHQQIRFPDVFWREADVNDVVIFRFVPRQVDVVPLLKKKHCNQIFLDGSIGIGRRLVSLRSQKVMAVNFGPFGNIVFFIAMGQQMEMSISR